MKAIAFWLTVLAGQVSFAASGTDGATGLALTGTDADGTAMISFETWLGADGGTG